MRLLDTETGLFHEVSNPMDVPYAILSHRWDDPNREQSYQHVCAIQASYQNPSVLQVILCYLGNFLLHLLPQGNICFLSDVHSTAPLTNLASRFVALVLDWIQFAVALANSWAHPSVLNDPRLSRKIRDACAYARADGHKYLWIDSCCIDKSSSSELSEAINAMYRWYEIAVVCYAYLSDVRSARGPDFDGFFRSQWHTRGWTLQELLAPDVVVFLSAGWVYLGTKASLATILQQRLDIHPLVLTKFIPVRKICVAEVMSWAASRETTREEDRAYCLLGLFGVHMSTLYGEGDRAFVRLQEAIWDRKPDPSVFAWNHTRVPRRITDLCEYEVDPSVGEGMTAYRSRVGRVETRRVDYLSHFAIHPADFLVGRTIMNVTPKVYADYLGHEQFAASGWSMPSSRGSPTSVPYIPMRALLPETSMDATSDKPLPAPVTCDEAVLAPVASDEKAHALAAVNEGDAAPISADVLLLAPATPEELVPAHRALDEANPAIVVTAETVSETASPCKEVTASVTSDKLHPATKGLEASALAPGNTPIPASDVQDEAAHGPVSQDKVDFVSETMTPVELVLASGTPNEADPALLASDRLVIERISSGEPETLPAVATDNATVPALESPDETVPASDVSRPSNTLAGLYLVPLPCRWKDRESKEPDGLLAIICSEHAPNSNSATSPEEPLPHLLPDSTKVLQPVGLHDKDRKRALPSSRLVLLTRADLAKCRSAILSGGALFCDPHRRAPPRLSRLPPVRESHEAEETVTPPASVRLADWAYGLLQARGYNVTTLDKLPAGEDAKSDSRGPVLGYKLERKGAGLVILVQHSSPIRRGFELAMLIRIGLLVAPTADPETIGADSGGNCDAPPPSRVSWTGWQVVEEGTGCSMDLRDPRNAEDALFFRAMVRYHSRGIYTLGLELLTMTQKQKSPKGSSKSPQKPTRISTTSSASE